VVPRNYYIESLSSRELLPSFGHSKGRRIPCSIRHVLTFHGCKENDRIGLLSFGDELQGPRVMLGLELRRKKTKLKTSCNFHYFKLAIDPLSHALMVNANNSNEETCGAVKSPQESTCHAAYIRCVRRLKF
jgi:hypothetical protein